MKTKLTKKQHIAFCRGFQEQHDDMFADLKEYHNKIQDIMLSENRNFNAIEDFEDFGRNACLYKLQQYIKQAILLRDIKGLTTINEGFSDNDTEIA